MSADYLTFHVALDHELGTRLFRRLLPRQRLGALIGPSEETLFDFASGEEPPLAALAQKYAGKLPPPGHLENAYVDIDPSPLVEILPEPTETILSSAFSVLAVLDRVLAIPRGVDLLSGQAVALFHGLRVQKTWNGWRRLLRDLGGTKAAAEIMRRYLRHYDGEECATVLASLNATFEQALEKSLDVLFFATKT